MNLATPSDEILVRPSAVLSEPGAHLSWQERREWFRARLQDSAVRGVGPDEMAGHFAAMPAHYWERVNQEDLVWGLETIHGFLSLVAAPNVPPTTPFVDWRQLTQSGQTRIMLCTWDRHGLLAKAAAAFSAVRLNILEADVFTRADNVVLDVFCVADADGRGGASRARLEEMRFLVEGALSQPPRFASVWACLRHKYCSSPVRVPPRIVIENDGPGSATLVRVEASDRLGLLYDILQSIADSGLNITQARIETQGDLAHDSLYVTDTHGQKVLETCRLEELRRNLEAALTQ